MQVSIIGSGYVGTTVAACFAEFGHDVVNIDVDPDIVKTINNGDPPIHEDGLADLVATHAGAEGTGRLSATTDYDAVLDTDVTFLCLPTRMAVSIYRLWRRGRSNSVTRSRRSLAGTRSW